METALAAQIAEDLRLVTHVAAAKSVVNQRTLVQGVVMPATKSHVSASVPTASSLAAYAARTAENILAHANNIADKIKKMRNKMSAVKSADNSSVTAA